MIDRLKILKLLKQKINAQSYLEIGVETGYTFNGIGIANKIGVDPNTNSAANVFDTSDNFFANNNQTFDLIFIDGLHIADQVERDINNSLNVLNDNGYIVCHDMLPTTIEMQFVPRIQSQWTGDCWKTWVKLRSTRTDISMYVIDTDMGCGVIRKGQQKTINVEDELTFENFCRLKQEWMNIITIQQFIEKIGSKNEMD